MWGLFVLRGREGCVGFVLFLDEHEQPCIAEEGFLFKAKE